MSTFPLASQCVSSATFECSYGALPAPGVMTACEAGTDLGGRAHAGGTPPNPFVRLRQQNLCSCTQTRTFTLVDQTNECSCLPLKPCFSSANPTFVSGVQQNLCSRWPTERLFVSARNTFVFCLSILYVSTNQTFVLTRQLNNCSCP